MRERLYQITRQTRDDDLASQVYDLFIVVISCLSIVPLMFRSSDALASWYIAISSLELITVYLIGFDYVLGWATADFAQGKSGLRAFAKYPFTFSAIVELLSILPSLGVVPGWLRILRLFMLTRLVRYSRSLAIVSRVLVQQKRPLLSVFYVTLVYIFASALFMFQCEPEMFDSFFDSLYWSVTAVTTVGYGDIVPVTDLGRFIGMVSSIIGIAVIALPSGIMTAGYMAQLSESQKMGERYFSGIVSLGKLKQSVRDFFSIGSDAQGDVKGPLSVLTSMTRRNRKLRAYAIVMLACFLLDVFFYQLVSRLGLPFWLDMTGTAIAAVLLEPVAGVLVGYANNLVLSIQLGNAASLLFFAESALTAVAFGLFFHWERIRKPKNVLYFILVAVVAEAGVDCVLHFLFGEFVICQPWEMAIKGWFESLGFATFVATFMECLVSKTIDIVAVIFISMGIIGIVRGSKFDTKPLFEEEAADFAKAEDVPHEDRFFVPLALDDTLGEAISDGGVPDLLQDERDLLDD